MLENRFLEEVAHESDDEYAIAMAEALDACLNCDLFTLNDHGISHIVGCRMQDNPLRCGGPYHRMQ